MMMKRWWRFERRIYEIKQKEIVNPKPTKTKFIYGGNHNEI